MTKNKSIPVEEWLTIELFEYCIILGILSPDEKFEDWMNNRTDLYQMVRDDINN